LENEHASSHKNGWPKHQCLSDDQRHVVITFSFVFACRIAHMAAVTLFCLLRILWANLYQMLMV